MDDVGWLAYPARVVEVRELKLILKYNEGIGTGVELIQNVTPRIRMSWHPKFLKGNSRSCSGATVVAMC